MTSCFCRIRDRLPMIPNSARSAAGIAVTGPCVFSALRSRIFLSHHRIQPQIRFSMNKKPWVSSWWSGIRIVSRITTRKNCSVVLRFRCGLLSPMPAIIGPMVFFIDTRKGNLHKNLNACIYRTTFDPRIFGSDDAQLCVVRLSSMVWKAPENPRFSSSTLRSTTP